MVGVWYYNGVGSVNNFRKIINAHPRGKVNLKWFGLFPESAVVVSGGAGVSNELKD